LTILNFTAPDTSTTHLSGSGDESSAISNH